MTKKYELLLFDFDGTLVDTLQDIAYYANLALREFGQPPCDEETVRRSIGLGVHELLKGASPRLAHDAQTLESAVEFFKKRYREEPVRRTRPFPHVPQVLAGPLKDVRKAIVTNKPQDITVRILEVLGLSLFFEDVIGMHAGYPPKPDPASVISLIRKTGTDPQRTIYIGDSRVDRQTSENAGVDFCWVDYGYDRIDEGKERFRFSDARDWAGLVGAVQAK